MQLARENMLSPWPGTTDEVIVQITAMPRAPLEGVLYGLSNLHRLFKLDSTGSKWVLIGCEIESKVNS